MAWGATHNLHTAYASCMGTKWANLRPRAKKIDQCNGSLDANHGRCVAHNYHEWKGQATHCARLLVLPAHPHTNSVVKQCSSRYCATLGWPTRKI